MIARAIALATALAVSGCSFVFVDGGRKPNHHEPPPSCTRHYAVPIVDAAIAALALGGVIYFATSDNETKELGMVVEGGIAAGFGISALLGRAKVKRCRSYQLN